MTQLYDRKTLLARKEAIHRDRPAERPPIRSLVGRMDTANVPLEVGGIGDPTMEEYYDMERSIYEKRQRASESPDLAQRNTELADQLAMLKPDEKAIPKPKGRPGKGLGNTKPSLALHEGNVNYEGVTNLTEFVQKAEGFQENSYWDSKHYSIGYGSKSKKGATITEPEALKLLKKDLADARKVVVKAKKKHGYDWDTNQIDALTSFTHNLGQGNFGKLIDNGKRGDEEIIMMLPEYNKAKVDGKLTELPGLTDRRNMEVQIFNQGYSS